VPDVNQTRIAKRLCIAAGPCAVWCSDSASSHGHADFQSAALPTELSRRKTFFSHLRKQETLSCSQSEAEIPLEQRYYISSKALARGEFARAMRGHRAIENSLHWVLDVTMGEDDYPIYRGDAAEILVCIRHMGLNMLSAETSRKASVRWKQNIVGMSSEYLEKVLNAGLKKLSEI